MNDFVKTYEKAQAIESLIGCGSRAPSGMFSCEFCVIFQNSCSIEFHRMPVSEILPRPLEKGMSYC